MKCVMFDITHFLQKQNLLHILAMAFLCNRFNYRGLTLIITSIINLDYFFLNRFTIIQITPW